MALDQSTQQHKLVLWKLGRKFDKAPQESTADLLGTEVQKTFNATIKAGRYNITPSMT